MTVTERYVPRDGSQKVRRVRYAVAIPSSSLSPSSPPSEYMPVPSKYVNLLEGSSGS